MYHIHVITSLRGNCQSLFLLHRERHLAGGKLYSMIGKALEEDKVKSQNEDVLFSVVTFIGTYINRLIREDPVIWYE